jgi:hypothetical protein
VLHVKDGVEWVVVIGQNIVVLPMPIENPCDVIKIHELPQNPPACSFKLLKKRVMVIMSM